MADALRTAVRDAIFGFASPNARLPEAAANLLGALGYRSDRTVPSERAIQLRSDLDDERELTEKERSLLER